MKYLNREPNYNKYPTTYIDGYKGFRGYDEIINEIKEKLNGDVLAVDCYPGVNDEEVLKAFTNRMSFKTIIKSEDIFFDKDKMNTVLAPILTEDRVRGVMYYGNLMDFVEEGKLLEARHKIDGMTLIYGPGASLISRGNLIIYADMARWEIQLRYRKGMPNFRCDNYHEDNLKKFKRGYFFEWRVFDKHKVSLFDDIDYYLDTNVEGDPKMVAGEAFLIGLKKIAHQPFRLVPYFDPGVWGGHWMQEVCDLDKNEKNFAWSFDGVPEENSIYLSYGDVRIESPAMNLVKYQPRELLGQKNFSRFGSEYPIRFDFLDTMGGQNLSLQVHPLTEYIKTKFGMTYTQDESYYILDCEDGGGVYLGLKENINKEEMFAELESAQRGECKFNAEEYVNLWPAKKHDHFLIPGGTIHCSSAGCMVLEVSATPYIFTFKLWDWDRLGLDGLPRPIHLEDGKQVIQFDRTTKWVKENLVNNFKTIVDNDDYKEVKTGLHDLEFIETHVYTFKKELLFKTNNEVNQLNLVEGSECSIESPTGAFEPFVVHYAETFIVPASVDEYIIKPLHEETIKVLKAYVRH